VFLLSPYRAVLRTPHACGAFFISLVGRLCYGIVSLSLILTLTAGGRDYGFAGLVMAVFGAAVVLVSPFRAWLIDRYGPRRALPPMAAGFAAVLVAIALIPARSGASAAAVAVLAAAAGACAPPLGVVMRTLWSVLIDDRAVLQTAYSLDGVAEELLYVAGPVIAGVITVVAASAVGLLLSAGLAVAGAVLSGQLIGRIPLSACLPVLAAPALLAVVPLLRVRFTPAAERPVAPAGAGAGTGLPG
jgi:MFS family permease